MIFSRDMVLREKRGRVKDGWKKDAYRNITAVLLIVLLCGCAKERYHEPTQCEIEAEARAVNAIHKQLREGK